MLSRALTGLAADVHAAPAADAVAMLARYRTAWARADAVALAALYTPDAELLSVVASSAGRADIGRLYRAAFDGGLARSRLTTRLDGARSIAPGVAYGSGVWRIEPVAAASGGAVPAAACGRFFAVLRRAQNVWRLAAFSESALACATDSP